METDNPIKTNKIRKFVHALDKIVTIIALTPSKTSRMVDCSSSSCPLMSLLSIIIMSFQMNLTGVPFYALILRDVKGNNKSIMPKFLDQPLRNYDDFMKINL
jgi:hypothetical protein